MLIDNGKSLVPFWLVAAAGRPTDEVRLDSRQAVRRPVAAAAGIPVARLADQDTDGVAAEVDLPVGRHVALQPPRRRLPARVLRGVQPVDRRVLRDRARPPDRDRPDRAAHARRRHRATSRRSRRWACAGVMLPGVPPQADYDDPMYDELWDAMRRPRAAAVVPHPHEPQRHAGRRPRARPEAQQLHVDRARQPGHHRHDDLRRGVRASSRLARRVRRGRRGVGAALDVPRRPRVTTATATGSPPAS